MKLNKFLIATLLAMCVIGFCMSDVSAKDFKPDQGKGWDSGYTNWTIPTESKWTIDADRRQTIAHSNFKISEATNGSHFIDLGKGKFDIDPSFKGKTLLIQIDWTGTPHNNRIIVPIYPGGNIKLKASYGNSVYGQSWMDLSINGWHNNGLGAHTDGIATYSLPDEAWS